jgi:hypothetical protein
LVGHVWLPTNFNTGSFPGVGVADVDAPTPHPVTAAAAAAPSASKRRERGTGFTVARGRAQPAFRGVR